MLSLKGLKYMIKIDVRHEHKIRFNALIRNLNRIIKTVDWELISNIYEIKSYHIQLSNQLIIL